MAPTGHMQNFSQIGPHKEYMHASGPTGENENIPFLKCQFHDLSGLFFNHFSFTSDPLLNILGEKVTHSCCARTGFHFACYYGHAEVVQLLLEESENKNIKIDVLGASYLQNSAIYS